jgi:hypothetical protein
VVYLYLVRHAWDGTYYRGGRNEDGISGSNNIIQASILPFELLVDLFDQKVLYHFDDMFQGFGLEERKSKRRVLA